MAPVSAAPMLHGRPRIPQGTHRLEEFSLSSQRFVLNNLHCVFCFSAPRRVAGPPPRPGGGPRGPPPCGLTRTWLHDDVALQLSISERSLQRHPGGGTLRGAAPGFAHNAKNSGGRPATRTSRLLTFGPRASVTCSQKLSESHLKGQRTLTNSDKPGCRCRGRSAS